MRDMRVVICCVTFEVAKVVEPIRHYRADRVHLVHWGDREPYSDFIGEVEGRIRGMGAELLKKDLNIMEFSSVLREVRSIIMKERMEGNHVYVNIGAGPQVFSSAAMIACMMEGGIPFNAATKSFTVESALFYSDGKPVGIAKEVHPPREIPVFKVEAPDPALIRGLAIWEKITDMTKSHQTREVMREFQKGCLLDDIFEDDRQRTVSQGALMKYRRNFLEKWESNGWVKKDRRGSYSLTEQGQMMLRIFT